MFVLGFAVFPIARGGMADNRVGFTRPEMNSLCLAGTANADVDRHLFLVWGKAAEWPEKVPDECAEGSLPKVFGKALGIGKKSFSGRVKWTMVEAAAGDNNGDVLVFPDYVRLNVSAETGMEALLALLGKAPGSGCSAPDIEELSGGHTFFCAHAKRDARCGHCGPHLAGAVAELQRGGQFKDVTVRGSAHVGGHVYAGNAIVFSGKGAAEDGHWYGYVTPTSLGACLSGAAARGPLWRGRLGAGPEQQKAERRMRLARDSVPLVISTAIVVAAIVCLRWRAPR